MAFSEKQEPQVVSAVRWGEKFDCPHFDYLRTIFEFGLAQSIRKDK